jgi:hypothetical protein
VRHISHPFPARRMEDYVEKPTRGSMGRTR